MHGISTAPLESARLDEAPARVDAAETTRTFGDFYAEHLQFVWRNVRHLIGFDSAVDDVVQEVFLVAMRRLPEFEGRAPVRSWLYGILRRVTAAHRRGALKHKGRDSVDLDALATRDSGPQRTVEKAEALRVLYEILDKLDDEKREVYVLTSIERMSASEVAAAIGINVRTVEARLRDARRELAIIAQRYRLKNDAPRDPRRGKGSTP
jgi:RNA polymerase sigma-70 factor (ECF subfamily)